MVLVLLSLVVLLPLKAALLPLLPGIRLAGVTNSIHCYDVITRKWTRYATASAYSDGMFLLCGGRDTSGIKLWTEEEDKILMDYIMVHGKGKWNRVAKVTGLKRCGKSCRLRWMNYLSPNVKRGDFSEQEEDLIIRLHKLLGNRWSLIAGRVPGRTDNQVKNHWNTHLSKKLGIKMGMMINKRKNSAVVSSSRDGDHDDDNNSARAIKKLKFMTAD